MPESTRGVAPSAALARALLLLEGALGRFALASAPRSRTAARSVQVFVLVCALRLMLLIAKKLPLDLFILLVLPAESQARRLGVRKMPPQRPVARQLLQLHTLKDSLAACCTRPLVGLRQDVSVPKSRRGARAGCTRSATTVPA